MKKKVFTGLIGTAFAITLLFLQFYPMVMELAVMFFSAIANFEVLRTVKVKNKGIYALTTLMAVFIPLTARHNFMQNVQIKIELLLIIYTILLLILMLAQYSITRFEHVAIALFSSTFLPYTMSMIPRFSDLYRSIGSLYTKANCSYLLLFALICAWMTDAMAYFWGRKFGKHKMSPKISPKKSWEGAVGGVACTVGVNVLVWLAYMGLARAKLITPLFIPLWVIPPASVLLSVAAMLGDLSFSAVKRNYGIKDFGKLLGEGNGGVMDRFDSASFVLPALYMMVQVYEAVK